MNSIVFQYRTIVPLCVSTNQNHIICVVAGIFELLCRMELISADSLCHISMHQIRWFLPVQEGYLNF